MKTETNFILYGHGGSYNHGAEAIVRCTIELLRHEFPGCNIVHSSYFPEQDIKVGIPVDEIIGRNLDAKIQKDILRPIIKRITPNSVCLHLGGDNYCYDNWERYFEVHKQALAVGAKSILWSCSVEPSLVDNKLFEVLRTHHLITARENVTYNALIKRGLTNVVRVVDIAFKLIPKEIELKIDNYVVLNFSPLVVRKNQKVQKAMQALTEYILYNTDMNIALVPHVVMPMDNDFEALNTIIGDDKRIWHVSDRLIAAEYKYIISKARFCVAARTHACIAGYSSAVPTLAIGYSCKALGIAQDLGMSDYIIDINSINCNLDLVSFFSRLMSNEVALRKLLNTFPGYIRKGEPSSSLKSVIEGRYI